MRKIVTLMVVTLMLVLAAHPRSANAADKADIDRDADATLQKLYKTTPAAKALGEQAVAVLIFPKIRKAGFVVGGQGGNGVLRENGVSTGYYRSVAVSYGLQAGVQSFGYVMFFMKPSALEYLDKSEGWEIGVGPSLVIVDKGAAKTLSTTTAKADIYAFIFGQKGLMAGIGLQGTKITKIEPD